MSKSTVSFDVEVMKSLMEAAKGSTEKEPGSEYDKLPALPTIDGPDAGHDFRDVFGFSPTSRVDHKVRVFSTEDWHEDVRQFIPAPDYGYVFPKIATEMAVVGIMQGDRTLLYGPKGSGKSSLFKEICARLKIPFIRVNGRHDMESAALFGAIDPSTMTWRDGPAAELGRHGGFLCVDEISLIPAGIAMAMQYMLEDDGKIYLADKPGTSEEKLITPHPWFRIGATDNTVLQGDTTGRYVGANVQNEALLDRFGTTIELKYIEGKHEQDLIISRCPKISRNLAMNMVRFAGIVRGMYDAGNIQFTLSPRALVTWGKKIEYWNNTQIAFYYTFFNKLTDTDKKQVAEAYYKVFATEVTNHNYRST